MQGSPDAPAWAQYLPLIVVVVLIVVRMVRPQRISVTRMWLSPIILGVVVAFSIFASEQLNPAPPFEIALGLIVGAIAGIPFGLLRGRHTDVRLTDRPGVMYLGASWQSGLIFAVAFGFRYVVRLVMPHRGALSSVISDALLAFAIAYICTSYLAIYKKYQAELAGKIPSAPEPIAEA
ncbi:MAG TPA: hypothetical protein VK760_13920 [Candidatus Acidoferrales bacterium]|jgi:hypothetical protein|nr:hypothetical protein [Candidatus Acidoferrales bacterium]